MPVALALLGDIGNSKSPDLALLLGVKDLFGGQ
jgi:hypothetical protein